MICIELSFIFRSITSKIFIDISNHQVRSIFIINFFLVKFLMGKIFTYLFSWWWQRFFLDNLLYSVVPNFIWWIICVRRGGFQIHLMEPSLWIWNALALKFWMDCQNNLIKWWYFWRLKKCFDVLYCSKRLIDLEYQNYVNVIKSSRTDVMMN